MPVHKVAGGYKWGSSGKVYKTKAAAERQARAIYATGWRGDRGERMSARARRHEAAKVLRASKRAEARLERALAGVMRGVRDGLRPLMLQRLNALAPEARQDAARSFPPPQLLPKLFAYVRTHVGPAFDAMAKTVDEHSADAHELLGIVPAHVPGIGGVIAQHREDLVRAVQQAAGKYSDELAELLEDDDLEGMRVEDLAKLLEERGDVAEGRARFLARDQTLKTNAAITQHRQRAAGITEYTWSTSRDEKVRPGHAKLEGERCSYDDPPVTDDETGETNNPGEDWQCRCVPIPVIPAFEEEEEEPELEAAE